MAVSEIEADELDGQIGLHQLACNVAAEVVGLAVAHDEDARGVSLRLLEIGFLTGEPVRVIAHGYPGHDPLAVRIGHTTFALRSHEAALVTVRLTNVASGAQA